jgi:hypothetical protein
MQITRLIELSPKGYDFDGLQPFIFSQNGHLESDFPPVENIILSCPFPFFSIEIDGYMGICGDKVEIDGLKDAEAQFRCLCIRELSPGDYQILALMEKWHNNELIDSTTFDLGRGPALAEAIPIVHEMLSRLQIEDNGTTGGHGRARYKRADGSKGTFRPRGVIYIGNKNKALATSSGHVIDWRNSWNVRAHWRKLANPESLGLDRKGERAVKGYTWIGHYKKGEGPIVDKVRKVVS